MLAAKNEEETKVNNLSVVKNDPVEKNDRVASDEEVLAISKKINEKYPDLFKALAHG